MNWYNSVTSSNLYIEKAKAGIAAPTPIQFLISNYTRHGLTSYFEKLSLLWRINQILVFKTLFFILDGKQVQWGQITTKTQRASVSNFILYEHSLSLLVGVFNYLNITCMRKLVWLPEMMQ